MLELAEKDGDNYPRGGGGSGEEAEREQSIVAVMVSSCSTQFSAQSTERNNHVLKRLVLKDRINFLTDTSLLNVYKLPWITCRSENYRL